MAKKQPIKEEAPKMYVGFEIHDKKGNTAKVIDLEFEPTRRKLIMDIIDNNGLTDSDSLNGIDTYYFIGEKYFYRDNKGAFVVQYSNQAEKMYNYSAMLQFVKELKF